MDSKYISAAHIEKLGHKIQEIRERALFNLVSKLENGLIYDNDLARSKELLNKLFNWFLFEPCSQENVVFKLLKRTLDSESGKTLIKHYGKDALKNELLQIRTYVAPEYLEILDQIIEDVDDVVPPLVSDVPLSYRSSENEFIGTTATVQEGFVQIDDSLDQQQGFIRSNRTETGVTYRVFNYDGLLDWQPLVEPDRHVLKSVETSLTNPPQPATLLHSCEFFVNVLLHDFPAEVFLQRPNILFNFFHLLETCSSTRVANGVLNSIYCMIKALQIRLNQNNDPALKNFKLQNYSSEDMTNSVKFGSSSRSTSIDSEKYEPFEDTLLLKKMQITLTQFCFMAVKRMLKFLCVKHDNLSARTKPNKQVGLNMAVKIIEEALILLTNTLHSVQINQETIELKREFNELTYIYGDSLDFYRLESASCEANTNSRILYIYLMHNCALLVKILSKDTILPDNFKSALSDSLLDVCLDRLYLNIHDSLLNFIDGLNLRKYKLVKKICQGMTASVDLMRRKQSLSFGEFLILAQRALPSLEFHGNLVFVRIFVDVVSEKLALFFTEEAAELVEDVTVSLLSHSDFEVKEEMYRVCHSIVLATIGASMPKKSDDLGSSILFLLSIKVVNEIAIFGINSDNQKIRMYSENIINHLIKCKVLVSEQIWNKIVEILIGTLPILCCYANKDSLIGRIVVNILDPDFANDLAIPKITVLKSNAALLFSPDSYTREEAFSRLCWLLASQENSRDFLPRLNNLYDKGLANVCQLPKTIDLNKIRNTQHFYQPSSIFQVMEVLKSSNIEPVIRRSALTQLSVMLEDQLLHQVFIDGAGVDTVVESMKLALLEQDFREYPDSVIPITTILKHLALHHGNVRETLSTNIDVIIGLLRSIFQFFTEERLKQDATILLFLLLYKDFIIGSPTKANFSIPIFLYENTNVPFICGTHWGSSPFALETLKNELTEDQWSLKSLQIQWNIEVFTFEKLLKINSITYENCDIKVPDLLKINDYDLYCLQLSSMDFSIENNLKEISLGSHLTIIESINNLILCVNLNNNKNMLSHPWEKTLKKFLKILPSSAEDVQLLQSVIKLLQVLVPHYKNQDTNCWIINFLKKPTNYILDLLSIDSTTDEEMKMLSEELLKLISICVSQEQHYLDFYNPKIEFKGSWSHVINILIENLKFSDAQHFYNLAYLDSVLSCLVHLTASLGWSNSKPNSQVLRVLCELVIAFHCGKGSSAAVSVMGLSITRHVLLILNHLLAELQNCKVKGWEINFFDNVEGHNIFQSFMALISSRDVVLRASALQLFSGLVLSPRIALEVTNNVYIENKRIWEIAILIAIDNSEANIVRENALILLANLSRHKNEKKDISQILGLMETNDLFSQLDITLNKLFTLQYTSEVASSRSSTSSQNTGTEVIINSSATTPSLVKNIALFLTNTLALSPTEITQKLYEQGLLKQLLKTLTIPAISIENTKELSLYCDLMEMNTYVCLTLEKAASCNFNCLGTILNTRDCLNILISLLNSKIYNTKLPQLTFLRNRLWSAIFNLLTTLIETCFGFDKKSVESLTIISDTLAETGPEPFLEAICESLSSIGANDLQTSALTCLTSLLKVESLRLPNCKDSSFSSQSMQDLLDNVKTSRSFLNLEDEENQENVEPNGQQKVADNIFGLLEETYFGDCVPKITQNLNDDKLLSGAEICKVLIFLLEMEEIEVKKNGNGTTKKKSKVLNALSSVLCISYEAKKFAFSKDLLIKIVRKLRQFVITLSLDSVECLRRAADKKRVCPILNELNETIGLLTNFMYKYDRVKLEAAKFDIADIIHKLWVWFSIQSVYILDILKLLCTFTTNCPQACQSLTLTNPVAGSGPKKSPGNSSLLHVLVQLIEKEMGQISKTHNLTALELSFNILHNCSSVLECRIILSKVNLLQNLTRLHPSITKRQKLWTTIETVWLNFLQTFTRYPEGQTCVTKINEVLEIVMTLTNSSKMENRNFAMSVLRNLSFYPPNRLKLLASAEFLQILQSKLENGNKTEKNIVVVIVWSLAANSQKAKLILKSAKLDEKLQNVIKQETIFGQEDQDEDIERMHYVLNILR